MMDFAKTCKWMQPKKIDEDVVISSRVRIARNFEGAVFPMRMSRDRLEEILDSVERIVKSDEFSRKVGSLEFLRMGNLRREDRNLLFEKHLISPRHLAMPGYRGVVLGMEDSVSILVNEEDHLRIQGFLGGLNVTEALHLVLNIDDAFGEQMNFAFREDWGYLTSCPTNIGTAMRASVMVHLPALTLDRGIEDLDSRLRKQGYALRGYYGEGTRSHGDIYQISNQRTLGFQEEEIAEGLQKQVEEVVELERETRQKINREKPLDIKDKVGRSLGILYHGVFISAEEALNMLSHLRLGIQAGMELPFCPSMKDFNVLTVKIQAAHLSEIRGQKMTARERDRFRAQYLRRQLLGNDGKTEKENKEDKPENG